MLIHKFRFIYVQPPNTFSRVFKAFTSSTCSTNKEKWDLLSAVCLERKPVITPELDQLEAEYKSLLDAVEFERSLKSEHELKHEADMKYIEALKKGETIEDTDVILKQTAQEFEDAWTEELNAFKPAARITEADIKQDVKSLKRKLDKHLVLLVNQKLGNKSHYLLPQSPRKDGETLRQTAERVLNQYCGSDISVQILGNAPCGFYKYKYPPNVQIKNDAVGAKVFIYFARYLKGQISQKGVDYKWLDREELISVLPPKYCSSVTQMLIDD